MRKPRRNRTFVPTIVRLVTANRIIALSAKNRKTGHKLIISVVRILLSSTICDEYTVVGLPCIDIRSSTVGVTLRGLKTPQL